MNKCLGCYEPIKDPASVQEYHEKCSRKIFGTTKVPTLDYDYEEIGNLAKKVINNRWAIPGVQPKLSLDINLSGARAAPNDRLTIVGLWNGAFILKPPNSKYPELPENEDLTMHLAQACGMKTAMHCLIKFRSGEIAYIAKRFDRIVRRKKVTKLHQEDMCQLTGLLTENKYNSSMEKVAKATVLHTTNKGLELITLYQINVFSFLTGNSDMHLKNFSLMKLENKTIEMTPAYDLLATQIANPEDKEQTALTINGKKSRLSREDFDAFAATSGIPPKAADNVIRDFEKKLMLMKTWIQKSFLSPAAQDQYLQIIGSRAEALAMNVPAEFHLS